jgi:large subunit ribosomal protein L38
LKSGKEFIDYVQPFPMRGSGWHRCVFVLYEHEQPIDFNLSSQNSCSSSKFDSRNIRVAEFNAKYEKELTPVGLRFFQTEWDLSVKNIFHNYLSIFF